MLLSTMGIVFEYFPYLISEFGKGIGVGGGVNFYGVIDLHLVNGKQVEKNIKYSFSSLHNLKKNSRLWWSDIDRGTLASCFT